MYVDIALFFRDISTKILKIEDVAKLKETIAEKLCNLEMIFPPSFFDVMEHLPVHLPDEADLGGPVKYRWMYPFERFMYHLKKKVKNKARIGGSIVAQCVNEEISYVTADYITPSEGSDLSEDVHEVRFIYKYHVPFMFQQEGKISGKSTRAWLNDDDYNVLQTFLLLNLEEFAPYERYIYCLYIVVTYGLLYIQTISIYYIYKLYVQYNKLFIYVGCLKNI